MSAETLRSAAALMRERAEEATDGGHGWHLSDHDANEVWANRDAAGWDAFMVATTATRLNPNPGRHGHADATHIASWHPAVALAVADWLVREADTFEQYRASATTLGLRVAPALTVARAYLGDPAPASPDLGTGDGEAGDRD